MTTINWKHFTGMACSLTSPTPPPLNNEETEINTWSYYQGLFLSKDQAFSIAHAVSVYSGQNNS